MTTMDAAPQGATTDEFAGRLLTAVLGAQEVQAVYLGDLLGWYRALAAGSPLTSVELAKQTSTAERYAREWLEHQAVCGYVTVDDAGAAPTERLYRLPAGHAEVLTDADSLAYVAPLARFVAGVGKHLDRLAGAYRSGGGVSWEELGEDPREAQAATARSSSTNWAPPSRCCPWRTTSSASTACAPDRPAQDGGRPWQPPVPASVNVRPAWGRKVQS